MYSKVVLDRFMSPNHCGLIKNADVVATFTSEATGDMVKLYLSLDKDKIVDAKFKAFGSPITICAADIMCEMLFGKTLEEATALSNKEVEDIMDMPKTEKLHASVMLEELVVEATKIYKKKK